MYKYTIKAPNRWIVSVVVISALFTIIKIAPSVLAYPTYNDGCFMCHGSFTDSESPKGTIFPGNSKHFMHRNPNEMNTDCDLCHTTNDNNNPFIGSSNGTANNPGVGCTGCHGRNYGAFGDSGVGLREHHFSRGIEACYLCHFDDPLPLPENVLPTYYGTVDTNADDPCNTGPGNLENWSIGDLEGLNNDGDSFYDGEDPDCASIPCPWDLDQSRAVNTIDLLALFAQWGTDGPADFDGSGKVNTADLLILFANWGPCE